MPRKRKYTPVTPSATVTSENSEESQGVNVHLPDAGAGGDAQVSSGVQPGTSGVVAVNAVPVQPTENVKELAETPKPKAKVSKKSEEKNEVTSRIFDLLEREVTRDIPEVEDDAVELQFRSFAIQIKDSLNAKDIRRLMLKIQGVILDFIEASTIPTPAHQMANVGPMAALQPIPQIQQMPHQMQVQQMQPMVQQIPQMAQMDGGSFITDGPLTLQQL